LIFAKIQKPIEKKIKKSYWLFVEGTRVIVTYGLAYKNKSCLKQSITPHTSGGQLKLKGLRRGIQIKL